MAYSDYFNNYIHAALLGLWEYFDTLLHEHNDIIEDNKTLVYKISEKFSYLSEEIITSVNDNCYDIKYIQHLEHNFKSLRDMFVGFCAMYDHLTVIKSFGKFVFSEILGALAEMESHEQE